MIQRTILFLGIFCGSLAAGADEIDKVLNRSPKKVVGKNNGRANDRFIARLGKAQKLMASEKFVKALDLLTKLESSAGKNKFALSQVYQTRAYIYAQTEKYDLSIADFRRVVELGALPITPLLNSYYALSQVLASKERYKEALPYIQDYLNTKTPPRADAYFFYGQLLFQVKKSKIAIGFIEKANRLLEKPNKTWLSFLTSLYFEASQFSEAADTLQKIIALDSKNKKYWKQLSSVYIAMEDEKKALAALESALKYLIFDEEKEILRVVNMAIYLDIPYKAAQYLKIAMKNGLVEKNSQNLELLSDALNAAKEVDEAIRVMAQSVELTDDPEKYFKLGQLQIAAERWVPALEALTRAIKIDQKIKFEKSVALISLGIASFRVGKNKDAIDYLEQVPKKSKYFDQAKSWIGFIREQMN